MGLISFFSLAFVLSYAAALPQDGDGAVKAVEAAISAANPCVNPIIGEEYKTCPAKFHLQPDGSCGLVWKDLSPDSTKLDKYLQPSDNCAKYCELRQTFKYMKEVPLKDGYCHANTRCTVTNTKTTIVSWNANFKADIDQKLLNALKVGVTYGFNQGDADAHAVSYSLDLKDGECGYLTFIPIGHESCGSMTEAPGGWTHICLESTKKTTANYCSTSPWLRNKGEVEGEVILVRTKCDGRERLPDDKQDDLYKNHPEIRLPQHDYEEAISVSGFPDNKPPPPPPPPPAPKCTLWTECPDSMCKADGETISCTNG
ncbi:MAG: hypothetical protein M1825_003904 [Sarcosagium campestre]|nr:MAG: hypothetical protein M1825_003904 [Sarcosagium campestre]